MPNTEINKLRHDIPELSEWGNQDIEILLQKVQKLKTKYAKVSPNYDCLLTLGAALCWSEKSHKVPGYPELNKEPSQYIEAGLTYRENLKTQCESLAKKAQAWGGFWDPEDERKEDSLGWKERGSSIAPHVWISLKKRGFLPHINSPLEYEQHSLKGLEKCCQLFLKLPELSPSINNLLRAHQTLFKNISNQAGEFTDAQLFSGGYVGSDPRLIPYELTELSKQFERGMKAAKKMGAFKDAELIRTITFVCARLLRIQPFKEGNKRIIAAWALCALAREVSIPKVKDIGLYKNLHLNFKELRKGNLAPCAKKLCKALGVENPEHEVPSFWLSPEDIAPKQIDPKDWEAKNSNHNTNMLKIDNLLPKIKVQKNTYRKYKNLERESILNSIHEYPMP